MKHIAPRNPHPRRRVRHKHASRAIANAHKVFQRELGAHDRRMSEATWGAGLSWILAAIPMPSLTVVP